MSLLSAIESGEFRRASEVQKVFVKQTLNEISNLKNASIIAGKNSNVNVQELLSRYRVNPAGPEGFMLTEKYINPDVWKLTIEGSSLEKQAAQVLIDYASGKHIVDPIILYKASRAIEGKIPATRLWGEFVVDDNFNVVNYGKRNIFVSEMDGIRRKDLGDRSGTAESTHNRVLEIFKCYGN